MEIDTPGKPKQHAQRKRNQPTHDKKHKFEPFSKRIARLKIDPVHRVAQNEALQEDGSLSSTHFGQALVHWEELNLSRNFTSFLNQVKPLSESLPQILYHADAIFDALQQHIGAKDAVSAEPLLSLLAHFAHDLGLRFEKYFQDAIKLVFSVAATHGDSEVIEWSFTCLAWMLKYLSRLLVPDLRPLLAIVVPYLGRGNGRERPYMVRFAAESLAFLIRKAGAIYSRNADPLKLAVTFLFNEVKAIDDQKEEASYQLGLLTLFTEALQGISEGLHSSSVDIFRCLLDCYTDFEEQPSNLVTVLEGIIIATVHETNSETFSPLAQAIREFCSSLNSESQPAVLQVGARLLMASIGTRKGTRIRDWGQTVASVVYMLKLATRSADTLQEELQTLTVTISAMAFQYAPLEAILPNHSTILDLILSQPLVDKFFAFCLLIDSLGREIFEELVLATLFRVIASLCEKQPWKTQLLIRQLTATGLNPQSHLLYISSTNRMALDDMIYQAICQKPSASPETELQKEALAQLAEDMSIPGDAKAAARYVEPLRLQIVSTISNPVIGAGSKRQFEIGRAFDAYVRIAGMTQTPNVSIWNAIKDQNDLPTQRSEFLNALSTYMDLLQISKLEISQSPTLLHFLIENGIARSSSLRISSLQLIQRMAKGDQAQAMLSQLLQILETPFGAQTARELAQQIRRLVSLQNDIDQEDPVLRRIGPYFCLGHLASCPPPVAKELLEALASMCANADVEQIVFDVSLRWIQTSESTPVSQQRSVITDDRAKKLTRYQCSNLQYISTLVKDYVDLFGSAEQSLRSSLLPEEQDVMQSGALKLKALQVLNSMPSAAEKRSRLLMPIYLSMMPSQDYISLPFDTNKSTSSVTLSPEVLDDSWGFLERKAFVELLSAFRNPRSLFRSQEIYQSLLRLLMLGNPEMQTIALKAVLAWKEKGINKYSEHLFHLIDAKTNREELSVLFHEDAGSGVIAGEDRVALMPVLLRLLYGQMINRSRNAQSSQESKRKTVLRVLSRLKEHEISQFIDIALGGGAPDVVTKDQTEGEGLQSLSSKRDLGVLKMVESILETFQTQAKPFGEQLLRPVLRSLREYSKVIPTSEGKVETSLRSVRRSALNSLCMLFTYCEDLLWSSHLPAIFDSLVRQRLENFAAETSQEVSGLLRLFKTWASNAKFAPFFFDYEDSLLDRLADCLSPSSTKVEVKIFILEEVFIPLTRLATDEEMLGGNFLQCFRSHTGHLLTALNQLLDARSSRKLLESAVPLLVDLSALVDSAPQVEGLLRSMISLLRSGPELASPRIKSNILQSASRLLKSPGFFISDQSRMDWWQVSSALFDYFKDDKSRGILGVVLLSLSKSPEEEEVASLCAHLNSSSRQKLEEVDYDTRLKAFSQIDARSASDLDITVWEPVLQNLLYFSRTAEDFSIQSSAFSSLRHFILESLRRRRGHFEASFKILLLKALFKAAKAPLESVRGDHVALFGLLVQSCPEWDEINDMQGLLAGNDEEASFFNNILHIQYHRRTRAMRRLALEAEKGTLQSANICNLLLPLLESFAFDAKDDEGGRELRGHAIPAIGGLLSWVEWPRFRAIFGRFKSQALKMTELDKGITKLVGVAADALVSSFELKLAAGEDQQIPRLGQTLPSATKLSAILTENFIPDLASFIHNKDESQVTARIPIAITTVKLLKIAPPESINLLLPPLLLDMAYILRSRSQDSRDIARRTLADMVAILGPTYLPYVVKELRTSLSRGYQLHVLSYTVHSILVSNTDHLGPGDLDQSLDQLMAVIMDDIFGATGQEKDAEEYISQMREVKSNKSYDSMELLAKSTSVPHLLDLIGPLRAFLTGAVTSKQSRKVDELLRRMGLGLSRNPVAGSHDMLIFCYQVIKEVYHDGNSAVEKVLTNDEKNRQRFIVQLSRANKTTASQVSSSMFKLTKFSLDLLRSLLQRHSSLLKPEFVAGFLPVLGDVLVQGAEEVRVSAMRVLVAIMKLSIPELAQNADLYFRETVRVVKASISAKGEAAQAALKLAATIARDRADIELRDSDIAYLLQRVMPDLEEPDRQGISFNFVKAVMARKVKLPEVYDISKKIGTIMVTNHTPSSRDAARGIFVHFLLEFPLSNDRWTKHIKFLIKNLSYKHPEGRESVMEAVNMLLSKLNDSLVQDLIMSSFIPLVLVLANDENADCQRMAGILLGRCFGKANRTNLESMVDTLWKWTGQEGDLGLRKAGLRSFEILVEAKSSEAAKHVDELSTVISEILDQEVEDDQSQGHEMVQQALSLFSTITAKLPDRALNKNQEELWNKVRDLIRSPHHQLRKAAASLIGMWFKELDTADAHPSLKALPLISRYGLRLTAEAQLAVLRNSLHSLRKNWTDSEHSEQTASNLIFLGRCFAANNLLLDRIFNQPQALAADEEESSDAASSEDDEINPSSQEPPKAISYLLTTLCAILRREPQRRTIIWPPPQPLPKLSSLQILTSLVPSVPVGILTPLLAHTLLPPLLHITNPPSNPTTSHNTDSQEPSPLQTPSLLLLEALQKTLGSEIYVRNAAEAQRFMRSRRDERRAKRKIEAVVDPEGAGRERRRKREGEKERRKVKGLIRRARAGKGRGKKGVKE